VFFFCLGLSCVIPFIIGMKQSGFYILPSYPFFALCFAKLIENSVTEIVNKIILKITHHIVFKGIIIMLTAGIIISFFIQIQRIGRYKEKLPDIYEIIKKIPSGQTIGICQEMRVDWSLHGYFMRYGNISLDAAPAKQNSHLFYIVDNNCKEYDFLKDYYPVGLKTKNIHLYSK
ncbi:MAG: hypothetical protein HY738_21715, partial [Bacteroidia bacterium]|nr:hypothetical protein [Bacteroidia bacterium]